MASRRGKTVKERAPPKGPNSRDYFEAVRDVFALQAKVLTRALPHLGERGRNDEERLRQFLTSVLPRKFGIGTGFVISSSPEAQISRQVDIVIYDEVHNAPLHRELASFVFPVEMVYATIEVKGRLSPGDLKGCVSVIESVRALAKDKCYSIWGVAPHPTKPGKGATVAIQVPDKTAPRAFVVAFDVTGWKDASSFARSWARAVHGRGAHLHGVLVLSKGWFLAQKPFRDATEIKVHDRDALLRFHRQLLGNVQRFYMAPAHLDPYLDLGASDLPNVVVTQAAKIQSKRSGRRGSEKSRKTRHRAGHMKEPRENADNER